MARSVTVAEIDRAVETCLRARADSRPLVADVARVLGMSERQLTHAWRMTKEFEADEIRRLSVAQIIRRSRVLLAKSRIDAGDALKCARITAGFKGRADFNFLFKRYVGATPRAYRAGRLDVSPD